MYRDTLTLRQVWVRLKALPADSPLHAALSAAQEAAETARDASELDEALNRFKPKG